ncbi:hypothetical protein UP77_25030 [Escherichia coli]|nr:hypothetical protein UP77_25030 [Escherichia coli]
MQEIEKVPAKRFAGGLRTVAGTAVFAQITVTVRYPVVTRRARWRAGESTDKQNILLKMKVANAAGKTESCKLGKCKGIKLTRMFHGEAP